MAVHMIQYHGAILEREIIRKWVCQIGRDAIIPAKRSIIWGCSCKDDVRTELNSPLMEVVHMLKDNVPHRNQICRHRRSDMSALVPKLLADRP